MLGMFITGSLFTWLVVLFIGSRKQEKKEQVEEQILEALAMSKHNESLERK